MMIYIFFASLSCLNMLNSRASSVRLDKADRNGMCSCCCPDVLPQNLFCLSLTSQFPSASCFVRSVKLGPSFRRNIAAILVNCCRVVQSYQVVHFRNKSSFSLSFCLSIYSQDSVIMVERFVLNSSMSRRTVHEIKSAL